MPLTVIKQPFPSLLMALACLRMVTARQAVTVAMVAVVLMATKAKTR